MQNAAAFVGYLIDVSNMNDGYIEFDYVRISLTREKYWYEIRDVLVPIIHTVLDLRSDKLSVQQNCPKNCAILFVLGCS